MATATFKKKGKSLFSWGKDWQPIHHFREGKADGSADQALLLGGKGANLAEMCNLGLPVPGGFTIDTTTVDRWTQRSKVTRRYLGFRVTKAYTRLAKEAGHAPLVAIRSGAPVSMPGMMDTIPNVGLTSETLPYWRKRLGDRAAYDCRRRLIEEFGAVVFGLKRDRFHSITPKQPREMNAEELGDLCAAYAQAFHSATGREFPDDVQEQLMLAIEAVFRSWNNPRAIEYRKMEGIPYNLGTACNVQTMVFGNASDDSGTGVLFTRNPATGEDVILGEFLQNAQGEDVVAGTATPMSLSDAEDHFAEQISELYEIVGKLESHYDDMQDVEFTVEKGKLWILQTRNGKRTAEAAFRIAHEMVDAGRWDKAKALTKVTAKQYAAMQKVIVDPEFDGEPAGKGLPASPGFASGIVVTSNEQALAATEPCILVRADTDPEDLPGMNASVGILTGTGGATSHAAVVARAINTPCVTAFGSDLPKAGERITIDGSTGRVWIGVEVPTTSGAENPNVKALVDWAYEATGAMYEGKRVEKDRQRVIVSDWLADPESALHSIHKLESMSPEARAGIILDVRTGKGFRRDEDAILWECFGEELDQSDGSEEIVVLIETLRQRALVGTTVALEAGLREHAKALEIAGYRVGREVANLGDLLRASGPVEVSDEFIETVVGGHEVYGELMDTFKAAGKEVTPMPKSMSPQEVVAEAFGG